MGGSAAPQGGLSPVVVPPIRFLLDEHYPARLAAELSRSGIDAVAVVARADLIGATDTDVLRAATAEERAVVTEDVTTFSLAIGVVPEHRGVVYCRAAVFPRNPGGLVRLGAALRAFASAPPAGIPGSPFVWWLGV